MEENAQHFQHIMLYYFKEGKKATEMQKQRDLCSAWRSCYDWLSMSKVVCKVGDEEFLLDNAHWLGIPAEVDSDQIETLIDNQCYNT